VHAAHDGKVVLDPMKVDPEILAAAMGAHDHESDIAHSGAQD
jgi:hypothetical protein